MRTMQLKKVLEPALHAVEKNGRHFAAVKVNQILDVLARLDEFIEKKPVSK